MRANLADLNIALPMYRAWRSLSPLTMRTLSVGCRKTRRLATLGNSWTGLIPLDDEKQKHVSTWRDGRKQTSPDRNRTNWSETPEISRSFKERDVP